MPAGAPALPGSAFSEHHDPPNSDRPAGRTPGHTSGLTGRGELPHCHQGLYRRVGSARIRAFTSDYRNMAPMEARKVLGSMLLLVLSSPWTLPADDKSLLLHDATPVRMRLNRTISSADATVGETVDFEVLDEVKIGDTVIIPRGATAIATVTQAQPKRRMGRGGKLDVNIDYVRTITDEKIALRAVKDVSGGGHEGAMTGAIVATSLLFFPAAPLFLFIHGKDITIPKGTEITAYTNGEIRWDPAKFVPGPAAPSTSTTATPAAAPESLPAATSVPKGPKLTNSDIIALKQGGFGDEVIISKIKASGSDYKLEVNDLLELKKAGVSDAVISSMLEASKR
jgi:hypothetical protein